MSELIFKPETHQYFLASGEELPSVTKILKEGGLVPGLPFFTELGRDVGTAVHEAISLDLRHDLDWEALHPMLRPFMRQWADFRAKTGIKFDLSLCEVPQYHPTYRFAGCPDIVGVMNGRNVLIDLKTGTSKSVGPQLAGYEIFPAIKKLSPTRFCLSLKGNFKLQKYSDSRDILVFLNALHKYQDKQKELQNGNHPDQHA